jgi:hypothetical protein
MSADGYCRLLIEDHEKVPIETMIMIATRAAIGISATESPSTTMKNSSMAPATKVESRPRPPDFTLMIDWPIMAQPAMPPMKPVAVLAMPWPTHSMLRFDEVSVRSSTMVWVISDSSRPTAATATE